MKCLATLIVLAILFAAVNAKFMIPNHITSHMVLQRNTNARVWGWGEPNVSMQLSLNSTYLKVMSDGDGLFVFELPVQPTNLYPSTIVISDGSTSTTLTDVLFGDVYLCSGQSNMQLAVEQIYNAAAEVADSINYPNIRLYSVVRINTTEPQNNTKGYTGGWEPSQPKVVAPFSAACYFAGRDTYKTYMGMVPIGLVASDWGGTIIEDWTSADTLYHTCGPVQPYPYNDSNPENGVVLFNGMIAPLLRMQFNAIMWYQGEQNEYNSTQYSCRFPAMINDWRNKFNSPSLPFFFVLLAPVVGHSQFPPLRMAQINALNLPAVYVANPLDSGDVNSPYGSIHSRAKQIVGLRLSLLMRRYLYGEVNLVTDGPMIDSIDWPTGSQGTNTINLHYSATPYNTGLFLADTLNCTYCCKNVKSGGTPFSVILSNGESAFGTATVVSDALVTVSVDISQKDISVIGLSLEYYSYPECVVKNKNNLVALPFYIEKSKLVASQ